MTFKLLSDGSPVKHYPNPFQTSYPNYLSIFFAMGAQADVLQWCIIIVIWSVQLNVEEGA